MAKSLYLECFTGIAGDMVVGALLDLGVSEQGLRDVLASLNVPGFTVRITRKSVSAIDACDFDVVVDAEHENHDHDMQWLFGDDDESGHEHHHEHSDHEEHDHGEDEHDHHHHDYDAVAAHHDHTAESHGPHGDGHGDHVHAHHEHRSLTDMYAIIDRSTLSAHAKEIARHIFEIIADAEAKAHGSTREEVHFHEVGAVDSVVDVISAAYCLDALGIDNVIVSPLAEGEGHVRSAHGKLPIPVPAVVNIVAASGLRLAPSHRKREFVTPTGAAIAAAVKTSDRLPDEYVVRAIGIGSGKRTYDPPSMVRALIIETPDDAGELDNSIAVKNPVQNQKMPEVTGKDSIPKTSKVSDIPDVSKTLSSEGSGAWYMPLSDTSEYPLWRLETEVDDCTGEALGRALDRLYEAGAREAHFVPVFMKKSRPGYQIQVICEASVVSQMERILFEDTTTIGVRRQPIDRTALVRHMDTVRTQWGKATVKVVELPDGAIRLYPEYASVAHLADDADVPFQDVYRAVIAAAQSLQE